MTNTARGEFEAPLALMAILPLYVPGLSPDGFADTDTVTLACGPFDDADRGENDSQPASDDRENDMSVCRSVFHTVNVCAAGAGPPCAAVNASRSVETSASGRGASGVAVGVGVAVGAGAGPPPLPPLPPGVGVGVIVGVSV